MWFKRITFVVASLTILGTGVIIGKQIYSMYNAGPSGQSRSRQPFNPDKFTPATVVRPFPAIVEIPVKSTADVSTEVNDDELVLGVEVAGQYRAYPINQLTGPIREIFNDVLGDVPLAATW